MFQKLKSQTSTPFSTFTLCKIKYNLFQNELPKEPKTITNKGTQNLNIEHMVIFFTSLKRVFATISENLYSQNGVPSDFFFFFATLVSVITS